MKNVVLFSIHRGSVHSSTVTALKRILVIAALAIPTLFFSCEGPEGAVGPKGDPGQVGQPGAQGPKGDKGEPGQSAGVFQISLGASVSAENGQFRDTTVVTGQNMAALEKGAVYCYIKSRDFWFPVPNKIRLSTVADGDHLRDVLFAYRVDNQSITSIVQVWEGAGMKYKVQDIRLVFAPAQASRLNAELDWTNYEEVRKAFNLPL